MELCVPENFGDQRHHRESSRPPDVQRSPSPRPSLPGAGLRWPFTKSPDLEPWSLRAGLPSITDH